MAAETGTIIFYEFLNSQEEEPSLILDTIRAAAREYNDYRTLSLMLADISVVHDRFESLWNDYETELDRQVYESTTRQGAPVSVQDIIGKILNNLRRSIQKNDSAPNNLEAVSNNKLLANNRRGIENEKINL